MINLLSQKHERISIASAFALLIIVMRKRSVILLLLISVMSVVAMGQRRNVNTARPQLPEPQYIPVYESYDVDIKPEFPGGERGLVNFINKSKEYPFKAYKKGISGRVVCSFIVCPDGSLDDIQVVKGVEESLNREALRIISTMPRWHAGFIGAQPVYVRCFLPITFRL